MIAVVCVCRLGDEFVCGGGGGAGAGEEGGKRDVFSFLSDLVEFVSSIYAY